MKTIVAVFILAIITFEAKSQGTDNGKLKGKRILLFTKNGKGYVHENIPASIAAIQKLGKDLSFRVDTTTNSALFADDSLKRYDAVIFSNTNNDVFDTEAQKVAFMRYIQAGGSFMGIHSASGTERNWKWFKLMLGATFLRHPPFQPFTVHVLDSKNQLTKNLPAKWDTKDEFYLFKEFNPAIKVLAISDVSTIKESNDGKNITPDVFGNRYPSVWCQEFDGGRSFYTALGHDKNDYANPGYLAHIIEGLKWLVDKGKLDYKKAHATSSTIDEMNLFK
ncbi:MAG: ThuA domain-containing protein [Chitinophagaceae bacterium]